MREDKKAPFMEHLEELRKRLIICIIAIVICFAVTYSFKESLFKILMGPLLSAMNETGGDMIYTSLPEPFFTYL